MDHFWICVGSFAAPGKPQVTLVNREGIGMSIYSVRHTLPSFQPRQSAVSVVFNGH
jgi:hypothetical protein